MKNEASQDPQYIYLVCSDTIQPWRPGEQRSLPPHMLDGTVGGIQRYTRIAEDLGNAIKKKFPEVHFLGVRDCCPYIGIPRAQDVELVRKVSEEFTIRLRRKDFLPRSIEEIRRDRELDRLIDPKSLRYSD